MTSSRSHSESGQTSAWSPGPLTTISSEYPLSTAFQVGNKGHRSPVWFDSRGTGCDPRPARTSCPQQPDSSPWGSPWLLSGHFPARPPTLQPFSSRPPAQQSRWGRCPSGQDSPWPRCCPLLLLPPLPPASRAVTTSCLEVGGQGIYGVAQRIPPLLGGVGPRLTWPIRSARYASSRSPRGVLLKQDLTSGLRTNPAFSSEKLFLSLSFFFSFFPLSPPPTQAWPASPALTALKGKVTGL